MTGVDYVQNAIRTDLGATKYGNVRERVSTDRCLRLLHGAIGMCTETGEIQDAIKKHIMYGKELDLDNLKEEVGDTLWYMALIVDELGTTFEELMDNNITKLRKRYPQGFTEKDAVLRADKQGEANG